MYATTILRTCNAWNLQHVNSGTVLSSINNAYELTVIGLKFTLQEVTKPSVQQNRFNRQSPPSQRRPNSQGPYPQEKFHRPLPHKQPLASAAPVHSPPPNPIQLGGSNHHNLLANAHRQPTAADRRLTDQGLLAAANLPTDSPRGQVTVAPSQTLQDLTPSRKKQPMYENVHVPRSESPASDDPLAVTIIRANYNFPTQGSSSQQANQPSVEQLKRQFQPQPHPPGRPTVVNGHPAERKDHFDGATLPNSAAKMTSTPGSGSRVSAVARQQPAHVYQPQPNPSASPRLQRPLKPSDMSELR